MFGDERTAGANDGMTNALSSACFDSSPEHLASDLHVTETICWPAITAWNCSSHFFDDDSMQVMSAVDVAAKWRMHASDELHRSIRLLFASIGDVSRVTTIA